MSAYRVCGECGAALDPGERCDCLPASPAGLIQPGDAVPRRAPRVGGLINANLEGALYATLTVSEGDHP